MNGRRRNAGDRASHRRSAEPEILLANRYVDIAVVIPPDFKRNLSVGDGFLAHIVTRAIVDLAIWPLVDPENHHQAAPRLQLPARHALAAEGELLALARLEQVPMNAVTGVTCAEFISRIEQANVITAGQALVQHDVEVHVHFIHREIEPAREQAVEL